MRRFPLSALLIAGLVGVGLVGCASAAEAPETPETPDAEQPSSDLDAAALCAAESVADEADVCVLEGVTSSADLDFTTFSVVKLIGGTFEGTVSVGGSAQQVVITESAFASDVTLNARDGSVVKLSSIAGTLNVAGGHGATLVKNTIGADLLCAGGVQANGKGNAVTGKTTGTCTRVV